MSRDGDVTDRWSHLKGTLNTVQSPSGSRLETAIKYCALAAIAVKVNAIGQHTVAKRFHYTLLHTMPSPSGCVLIKTPIELCKMIA